MGAEMRPIYLQLKSMGILCIKNDNYIGLLQHARVWTTSEISLQNRPTPEPLAGLRMIVR